MLSILGYKLEDHVIKKLVSQEFVKQLYLAREPVALSDPPKFIFTWGERATTEFYKMEILEFACKVNFFVKITF